jgi:methylmalonyl-CoA mutase N-terminal domain/subunit
VLKIGEEIERHQLDRLAEVKRSRDSRAALQAINDLRVASKTDKNLMPYVIEAVKASVTEQEICDVWRDAYGEYRDPGIY